MNDIVFIYGLCDSFEMIRYIGKTTILKQRMAEHRRKREWMSSFIILEETTQDRWIERERYWIRQAPHLGWQLENKSDGGDGTRSFKLREWHKKRIAAALMGNKNGSNIKHTDDARQIMRIKAIASWTSERRNKQSGNNHPRPCLGKPPWNKGLTKEDPRVAAYVSKVSKSKIGSIPWNKGLTKIEDSRLIKCVGPTTFRKGQIPWNKKSVQK